MISDKFLIHDQLRPQPPDLRQEEPDRLSQAGNRSEPRVGLLGVSQLVKQAELQDVCAGFSSVVRRWNQNGGVK